MNKNKFLFVFSVLGWMIATVAIIFLIKNLRLNSDNVDFEKQQATYPFISKRVLLEFPQDILVNFLDLRNDLRKQTGDYGQSFGLYFEYLPTGTSININGNNEFHAASLFKLPVVMAYFKHGESVDKKEDPEITLTQNMIDNQFGDLWKKGVGYRLKSSEAVDLALQNSDNTAARALVPLIDKKDFDSIYEGLDIDLNSDNNGAILTAKNYSSILKALYFSAVLNLDDSNLILEKLTQTKFPDKLAAGVPSDIPVAHKIGDYNDDKGNEAFMDCGIVYVPRRPYALCMLSIGDEQQARERMQKISQTIYKYVSSVDNPSQ